MNEGGEATYFNGIYDSMSYDEKDAVRSIIIPNSVDSVDVSELRRFSGLKEISVDDGNGYYSSKDGVLYSKDFTEILLVPPCDEIREFTVPETVKAIRGDEFNENECLEVLNIHAACKIKRYHADDGSTGYLEWFDDL